MNIFHLTGPPPPGQLIQHDLSAREGLRVKWRAVTQDHEAELLIDDGHCWTMRGARRLVGAAHQRHRDPNAWPVD